jgi:general secretion pathway protein H
MQRSATGIPRVLSTRGFTLLELLIVVAIVALLVSLAALSLGGIGGPRPDAELRDLADRIAVAHEESVLSGRTLGLRPTPQGLEFVVLALDPESRRAVWRAAEDGRLAPAAYAPPFVTALEVEGAPSTRGATDSPAIVLLPDGDMTPFRFSLAAPGASAARLVGAEDGLLRVEASE